MISLAVDIAGLRLRNPTMLASGLLGISGVLFHRVAELGAGAIVTKSIGPSKNEGYDNPTIVEVEGGLINAMGLPNPGIAEFEKEVKDAENLSIPLIGSIYGSSSEEYANMAQRMACFGVDAIELNLSCPHAEGLQHFSQNPALAADAVRAVRSAVEIPVLAKVSQETNSIAEIGRAIERAGAEGITAINTIRAMSIDIGFQTPILSNKVGGLSGHAIKPIAVRCVYELYDTVNIPIIGVGGVYDWKDALEFIMAGASAVQIGTAIALRGPTVFTQVVRGLTRYLKRHSIKSVSDLTGLAHKT